MRGGVETGALEVPVPVESHRQQDDVFDPRWLHAEVQQPASDPQPAPIAAGLDGQLVDSWQISPPILGRREYDLTDDRSHRPYRATATAPWPVEATRNAIACSRSRTTGERRRRPDRRADAGSAIADTGHARGCDLGPSGAWRSVIRADHRPHLGQCPVTPQERPQSGRPGRGDGPARAISAHEAIRHAPDWSSRSRHDAAARARHRWGPGTRSGTGVKPFCSAASTQRERQASGI